MARLRFYVEEVLLMIACAFGLHFKTYAVTPYVSEAVSSLQHQHFLRFGNQLHLFNEICGSYSINILDQHILDQHTRMLIE